MQGKGKKSCQLKIILICPHILNKVKNKKQSGAACISLCKGAEPPATLKWINEWMALLAVQIESLKETYKH